MTAKFLATESDRLGNTLQICQYPTLAWSPAYPLFIKTYAELVEQKLCGSFSAWDDHTCAVVYAELDGKVVGAIVYDTEHPEFTESLWITLLCVDPTYRQRGILKILFKYFENIARELGKNSILSYTDLNNHSSLKAHDSLGIKPICYLMGKKLNEL